MKKIGYIISFIILFIPNLVLADDSQIYLDYPNTNSVFGDYLIVDGWFMSGKPNSAISIYIDNKKVINNSTRYERPDVLEKINGYGGASTNPLPGFKEKISLDNYNDGTHIITISAYDSNNQLLNSVNRSFIIHKNYLTGYIDDPDSSTLFGDKLVFNGWIMSTNSNLKTKVYIDNNLVNVELVKKERPDVLKAINGYGDGIINPTPGFSANIPLQEYNNGTHDVKIIFTNQNNNVLYSINRKFNIKNEIAKINIDCPQGSIKGTLLKICGWIMSTNSNYEIKTYIDNQLISIEYERIERPDVLKAITNYGSPLINKKPGFNGSYSVENLIDGVHTVKTDVILNNKTIASDNRSFKLEKYKGLIHIDAPTGTDTVTGTNLSIDGWSMSNDKNAKIKLYIDNEEVEKEITRYDRPDVLNVYSTTYGNNSINESPGYIIRADISNIKDGNHTIKTCVLSNKNDILNCTSKTINIKKYISNMYIDSPTNNYKLNGTSLTISGWALSTDKNMTIHTYIDENDVSDGITRYKRDDVLNAYPTAYGDSSINATPGFAITIEMKKYKEGEHRIKIVAYTDKTSEVLYEISQKIYLTKNQSNLYLDYPVRYNFSNDTTLIVSGWELSDFNNATVKIKLDSTEMTVTRENRQDVLNAFPNSYGGVACNNQPGFTASYPLKNVNNGQHTITINIYNYLNEIINSITKKIYVYNHMYFGIDVSTYQGKIDWSTVSKTGIDFAIFRLGYGDNWTSQDDKQFINNVNGAANNKIPYGVYIYSYAKNLHGNSGLNQNSESIDSEIAHTLRLLNGLNGNQKSYLKLPVYIDMEEESTISLGKTKLTQFANHFCNTIKNNGYKCGIYANKNWLTNYLDAKSLGNKYDIWLAHYTNNYNITSSYTGMYNVWQYSSTGNLKGIPSQYLDMDVSYKKYW